MDNIYKPWNLGMPYSERTPYAIPAKICGLVAYPAHWRASLFRASCKEGIFTRASLQEIAGNSFKKWRSQNEVTFVTWVKSCFMTFDLAVALFPALKVWRKVYLGGCFSLELNWNAMSRFYDAWLKKDKKRVFSPTPHVFRRRIAWFDQSPHGSALGMQPAPRVSCSLQLHAGTQQWTSNWG